ncbi:Si-specific NAD(P)(+) transhydrogenase [Solirubrobacter phytolaccae]|uniref:NAD(P)(+) transhydrogenase (Si-specific) n=1 Tax=Solirubrobacter phytolaccae TaxID=1404360 RepID=A0A9X3NFY5_9ACTN|nr:Si-specific NAD(P)(+) transhydrogenase [Solirubrobacter phytolaccae]MDA0185504.1 Si-specific NAD(P)(+) transhydrogenase [Solirubrobacter phytolaccae]
MELDLLVIGSGPGGQRAAIQAAKLGKRVAVAERRNRLGGVSIHTGTIPSKTLRQATLEQLATRPLDVLDPTRVEETEQEAIEQLLDRAAAVVAAETAITREQFRRNRVGLLQGAATFVDANTVQIEGSDEPVRAQRIVIAVGTRPARPSTVEFDDRTIIDSDGLLKLAQRVPRTMTVVGAGVIGVEYASMFGALGTKVTVVDQRDRVLTFLDSEIGEAFQYLLRRRNVTFRLREKVEAVDALEGRGARLKLGSGKEIVSETVLYATGRQGDTEKLGLAKAGLKADKRGRITVDEAYRTEVEHIFAVGDCAGGAGLAATAMEQGRIAALTAFERPITQLPQLIPTGVYAIPELAMVGRTEEELTDRAVPYVCGIARWSELARGVISGDREGMLKLLVSVEDRSILGVHVLGTSATDLVHIGQAVMASGANGLDFLVTAVFNYPTFAESYKVAALDADNRIKGMAAFDKSL